MILYDKNGLFLGMGNPELSLLGYEDMEEFRNYHNDVADLFINKPGYICKFKNFSWIDYTLHSGTPNKRVLLKTKNGKEIESFLTISEIFLAKELNHCDLFFSIEFNHSALSFDAPNTPNEVDTLIQREESAPSVSFASSAAFEDTPTVSLAQEPLLEPSSFLNENPTETSVHEETPALVFEDSTTSEPLFSSKEYPETDFKLKIDDAILDIANPSTANDAEEISPIIQEPLDNKEYESIDQIQSMDFLFNANQETYPEDKHEDLLNDPLLSIQSPHVSEKQTSSLLDDETQEMFDLTQCADSLGLDISTLASIIEEYLESLDTTMPLLTQAIHDNNRMQAKEEIEKLKSIALHLQIIPLYQNFEHLETSLDFDTKDEILLTLKKLQNSVERFKESVS